MAKSGWIYSNFEKAIRRRVYPNTGLHPEQLAHIAGCSMSTFMRYWRGESRIPAEALGNLARFFSRSGDVGFIAEVYGEDIVPINRWPATEVAAAVVDILRQKGVAA
jgi:transcriptional regulator with XRE-family HTH domain